MLERQPSCADILDFSNFCESILECDNDVVPHQESTVLPLVSSHFMSSSNHDRSIKGYDGVFRKFIYFLFLILIYTLVGKLVNRYFGSDFSRWKKSESSLISGHGVCPTLLRKFLALTETLEPFISGTPLIRLSQTVFFLPLAVPALEVSPLLTSEACREIQCIAGPYKN